MLIASPKVEFLILLFDPQVLGTGNAFLERM
jgi:hypothetical protein